MEDWLKGTVPGIILLGAVGSIVAIGIIALFNKTVGQILPIPFSFHRRRRMKQAFVLGWSARIISDDSTGKTLMAALAFHIACLLVYLIAFLFCGILFSAILALQSRVALTWGSFVSSASAFTLLYLIYFEFEYIYRTYLTFWKSNLKQAGEAFAKSEVATKAKASRIESFDHGSKR